MFYIKQSAHQMHTGAIITYIVWTKHSELFVYLHKLCEAFNIVLTRLAPVLKTIFHQCVISYTCSQSYSDGSVLKQSHQSKTGYKYMI